MSNIYLSFFSISSKFIYTSHMRESMLFSWQNNTTVTSLLLNKCSQPWANFLLQTRVVGLVKHLSPYIHWMHPAWMAFVLSPFPFRIWITECYSILDAFNSSVHHHHHPLGRGPAYSGPIRWGLYGRPIALTLGGEEFSVNDVCKCMRDCRVGWAE